MTAATAAWKLVTAILTVIYVLELRSVAGLAARLLLLLRVMRGKETNAMLGTLLEKLSIPHVPVRLAASAGVAGSFVWLLGHDLIHPLVVFLLELYLTF